jgi:hypothetical protein
VKLVLAAAGVAILLATAAPAHAAPICWRALLSDWSDGSIDRTYAPRCYTTALARLPDDIRLYSSAEDDIGRALALTVRRTTSARTTASARATHTVRPAVARAADVQKAVPARLVVAAAGAVALAGAAAGYGLRRRSVRNVIE